MSFIQLHRGQDTDYMLRYKPDAFLILTLIALRARRAENSIPDGLELGEAMLGDPESCGLTRQRYRSALGWLKDNQIVTIKTSKRGTAAKIINTTVYDVNVKDEKTINQPSNNQIATKCQPDSNQIATTNNKIIKQEDNKYTDDDYTPAREFFEQLQLATGSAIPLQMAIVESWQKQGLSNELILQTVKTVVAKKKLSPDPNPPNSMAYFKPAMAVALAATHEKMEKANVSKNINSNTGYRKPSNAESADAALIRFLESQGLTACAAAG